MANTGPRSSLSMAVPKAVGPTGTFVNIEAIQ
jgi:hypothetical protein